MTTVDPLRAPFEAGVAEALVQALPVGVVVQSAEDGSIVYANDAACEILGLTRAQMVGRDSMDPRWRAIDSDGADLPGDRHPAMETVRTRRPIRGLMGVRRPDAGLCWIDVRARLLDHSVTDAPGYVFATFVDVTHTKELEDEAASARRRLELLLGETSDLLFVTDADGVITYASPPVAELLGAGGPGSVGTSVFDLPITAGGANAVDVLAQSVVRPGGHAVQRLQLALAPGDDRWFEVRARNRMHDPEVAGVVVTLIDVDAQVRSEAALRTANEDLSAQLRALDALRRVDRLLTDAGSLLRRSGTVDEAEAVLWDCATNVFTGADVALFAGQGDERFLERRFGGDGEVGGEAGRDVGPIDVGSCWGLRTERIHLNEAHSAVRCGHVADGVGLCIPMRLGGHRVLITVGTETAGDVETFRQSAEAFVDRLGGAANAALPD